MIAKHRGAVTIPRNPRSLGSVLTWGREVIKCLQQLRDRSIDIRGGGRMSGGTASTGVCALGEIIDIADNASFTKGIRGGSVVCGDKNFNVNFRGVNTAPSANSVTLISLKLDGIKFNTDDDHEIYLPGVETATGTPAFENTTWSQTANYPDNIRPATPTGTATIFVPLGKLTIKDGVPTFEATGCGGIVINQCAGVISFSRG